LNQATEIGLYRNWSSTIPNIEGTGRKHLPVPQPLAGSAQPGVKTLRVLIADDQLLVQAGICELLKALPDVAVVGRARDGSEALRLIETYEPDLVLMDLAMPEMNGLEATVLAKKQFPHVKVIILSDHPSEEFVFRALRSGADGFVLKDDPVGELYTAIKAVASGGEHLSSQVTKKVILGYLQGQLGSKELLKSLTPRQRAVLQLIAEGKSTKEIASSLKVSVNTAKTHRQKLMEKLGVHEITGVVRYAVKLGLIES
jgi:DNA-binding NarL/FixJ family response regulator